MAGVIINGIGALVNWLTSAQKAEVLNNAAHKIFIENQEKFKSEQQLEAFTEVARALFVQNQVESSEIEKIESSRKSFRK